MYAVIFRAKINILDSRYTKMAEQMRELAMQKYGCTEFVSATEADLEIAISYWQNLQQIQAWKTDAEHIVAQELGKKIWYTSYSVQVVEVIREYSK